MCTAGNCSEPSTIAWARSDSRRLWLRALLRSRVNASCDGHVKPFGEDPFGLLDQDPAVERGLQLLGEDVAAVDGALLQQADGGDVGEGLPDAQLALVERARVDVEEVQRADDLGAQPHRQCVYGGEPDLRGGGGETWPSTGGR